VKAYADIVDTMKEGYKDSLRVFVGKEPKK
jgi:hypothetical protein